MTEMLIFYERVKKFTLTFVSIILVKRDAVIRTFNVNIVTGMFTNSVHNERARGLCMYYILGLVLKHLPATFLANPVVNTYIAKPAPGTVESGPIFARKNNPIY